MEEQCRILLALTKKIIQDFIYIPG